MLGSQDETTSGFHITRTAPERNSHNNINNCAAVSSLDFSRPGIDAPHADPLLKARERNRPGANKSEISCVIIERMHRGKKGEITSLPGWMGRSQLRSDCCQAKESSYCGKFGPHLLVTLCCTEGCCSLRGSVCQGPFTVTLNLPQGWFASKQLIPRACSGASVNACDDPTSFLLCW